MSVICQNFVQNAWKKDLCSNCFKSVGDHEFSDNSSGSHENSDGDVTTPRNGFVKANQPPTPQTTWKSLIMSKNEKNNQPFKLETGFQGRLLTINTAVNVFEKKAKSSANVNGCVQRPVPTPCQNLVNGFKKNVNNKTEAYNKLHEARTAESFSKATVANGWLAKKTNLHQNSVQLNGCAKKLSPKHLTQESTSVDTTQNGGILTQEVELKCESSDSKRNLNKQLDKAKYPKTNFQGDIPNDKTGKVNGALQGILKKSPKEKENKSRRSSGVGFKEEDPVVIGYGGRDFSPEELEWEVASSDGESGGTSLDETEDDKLFSEVTKENTKFNADNVNLLQESKQEIKIANLQDDRENIKKESIIKNGSENLIFSPPEENIHSTKETKCSTIDNHMNRERTTEVSNFEQNINSFEMVNTIKEKDSENIDAQVVDKIQSDDHDPQQIDVTQVLKNMSFKENESCNDLKKEHSLICNKDNPSKNPATFEDCDSCDAISVTTTTSCHVTNDENKTSIHSGAGIASEYGRAVKNSFASAAQLTGASESHFVEKEPESIVYVRTFDEEFLVPNDTATNVNSGLVHEAFNTTLAVLQKMDTEDINSDVNSPDEKDLQTNNGNDAFVNSNKTTVSVDHEAGKFKGTTENIECDDISELNMTPRVSFLHGTGSEYKEPVSDPSAIYAPGSDFFVERSDSSSSSSSDEQSKRPKFAKVTVTESNIVNSCVIADEGFNDKVISIINMDDVENDCDNAVHEEKASNINITDNNTGKSNDLSNGTSRVTITSIIPNSKTKPEIPAKPRKPSQTFQSNGEIGHYARPLSKPILSTKVHPSLPSESEGKYYSATDTSFGEGCSEISVENHYAEANIYHEINSKITDGISEENAKPEDGIESKLALLAVELEQARHCNNIASSKRQAPSPPKIPDPPYEQPPSSIERSPSPCPVDGVNSSSVFRTSAIPFSSASSTTSSSSQDDAGFCSWTLHGDEEQSKSKWKNSFLLTQYSKCKMLAMGYNDGEKGRSKKKFSLKKLLKIGKEADGGIHSEYIPSSRKAWKYSDNFDRPRPKLDIIHPMDLENKTLTVNPGFDPSRSSTTSFTSGVEVISIRNSTSSDYGTYYSDTMSPEEPRESNYDYVNQQHCHSETVVVVSGEGDSPPSQPSGSTSPTPSRCSAYSQASTLTSGSSKNSASSGRPPKPPPPPRAHSLQPNKNSSTVYKSSISDDQSSSGGSVFAEETCPLPQAPKRLYRSGAKCDYANYDNLADTKSCSSLDLTEQEVSTTGYGSVQVSSGREENCYEFISSERPPQQYEDVDVVSSDASSLPGSGKKGGTDSAESPKVRCTETTFKSITARPKKPPVTKAPSRPPPIYTKLPGSGTVRENAWKTLEASYMALSLNNRDVLIKLVEQGIKRRPFSSAKNQENLQWRNFKLDASCPAKFFSSGEQVVYDALMDGTNVTLLITLNPEHHSPHLCLSSHLKYPAFAHFYSSIPSHLLLEDDVSGAELDCIQTSIYVLNRSEVVSLESYILDLPDGLNDHLEKELAFILLQVIQELKGLQVQGIEEVEPCLSSLVLAKTAGDLYYSLVFKSGDFYEESGNAYSLMLDDCKLSLCQYALLLLYQLFKVESLEELSAISVLKFTKSNVTKVFENVAYLLSEEKAVSLSQAKTLLECFIWGVQAMVTKSEFDINEADVILHRWIDMERSSLIKQMVNNSQTCINTYSEWHSQFLIRCNIRNIKDIIPLI